MLIQLNNVTKVYEMGVERIYALNGIDLEIRENEYVAMMGVSGSGKSTLMNLIGCLDRATTGSYFLAGKDTTALGSGELASIRNQQIGFVFQSFELLPRFNALKNVELPLIYSDRVSWWKRKEQAKSALERVGLSDRIKHRPNQLSGGEKQRVAIARGLVCQPHILLADEPTGNLDSKTSADILDLFDQLHHQGQTIIIVTHDPSVARHAKRVLKMHDGKIISDSLS